MQVPLDDTYIGSLLALLGDKVNLGSSDVICRGLQQYGGLGDLQEDECIIAGLVLVHGYEEQEMKTTFQNMFDLELRDECYESQDEFIPVLEEKFQKQPELLTHWKKLYTNFFRETYWNHHYSDKL